MKKPKKFLLFGCFDLFSPGIPQREELKLRLKNGILDYTKIGFFVLGRHRRKTGESGRNRLPSIET